MPTIEVQVRRFSVISSIAFEEVVTTLTETIGRPDMTAFHSAVAKARTVADLERVVQAAIGSSHLMEFVRLTLATFWVRRGEEKGPRFFASSSVIRSS